MKAIALVTCLIGCSGGAPPAGDDVAPPPPADANPECTGTNVTDVAGAITAATTWSGTINLTADTNIAAGVTVTVMPGTLIHAAQGADLAIGGTLDVEGTSACPVVARAVDTGWGGMTIGNGGELIAHYLDQTGGNIVLQGTAKATIVDSRMSNTVGDFIVVAGGTLDVQYSWIGVEQGEADTTHCDLHFAGTNVTNTIKVTHSNLSTASYGLMLYNGMNADLTYNNWFGNATDIDTDPARPATGDVSFGFFAKGTPNQVGVTATNLAAARLADAGPRP